MNIHEHREIRLLVEHIQLNRSGWLIDALKGILIQLYGERENMALTLNEVKDILKGYQEFKFENNDIEKAFNSLVSSKMLRKIEKEKYKLSETEYKKFVEKQKEFQLVEEETKNFFYSILEELRISEISKLELWNDFVRYLIQPLISKMGAKSFEIITAEFKEINYENNNIFFNKYKNLKQQLNKIAILFFNAESVFVRKYLLNLLYTYYFIEASSLPKSELDKIYKLSEVQSHLKIFIDTNFLLSILNLHDNPSNEAAKSLINLLEEVNNRINIKFYILPITIEEFRNAMETYKEHLKTKHLLLPYAKILIESGEVSGIIKKYYQKCTKLGYLIDINEYFDPYINNLSVILKKNRIEIFNDQNLANYSRTKNMDVNDDILTQVKYRISKLEEKKNNFNIAEFEQEKEKIELKFTHDCILWHVVNDRRPKFIDSIKDIKHWILTLDFQFLSYDRYKTHTLNRTISLCLHPNDLISLLSFWVPRSEKFEKAVLENFKLPFSFEDVSEKAEQVSLVILTALSYYENSEELGKDTVMELLTNQALRDKIKPDESIEENAKLIKDEIVEELNKKTKEIHDLKKELSEFVKKIDSFTNTRLDDLAKQLETIRKQITENIKIERKSIKEKINEKEKQLNKLYEIRDKFDTEYNKESKKIINKFRNQKKLRDKILSKYPSFSDEISELEIELKSLKSELEKLQYDLAEKTVFFCENKNAKFYNDLNLPNIRFMGEKDSSGVFIKVVTNPTYFGIRDRDFLTDREIQALKEKYLNYRILEYYCFENYLYHPENINYLNLHDFDKNKYIEYIKKQIKKERDNILLKLKNARNTYQEFKTLENGIKKDQNAENFVIACLDSDNIEENLKVFSLKDFNRKFLEKYNLSQSDLITTEWFIEKIKRVLE